MALMAADGDPVVAAARPDRTRVRKTLRHVFWSRWTLIYLPLAIVCLPLAAWILREPIATIGHRSVRVTGASGESIALAPCKPFGSGRVVHCGVLEVPEDPAAQGGRMIPLHFVVAFATGADPLPDPLFLLDGGPGVGKATIAGFSLGGDPELERDRDLVFVDVRGTGASNPLSCVGFRGDPFDAWTFLRSPGAYLSLLSAQHYLEDPYDAEAMAACRRQLETRADLTRYTTTLIAADLDAVRAALGYRRINLSGTSYGSRLGLEYMRRYPDRVRAASLSDIVPPDLRMPATFARDTEWALGRLLDDCELDPSCSGEYPGLRRDLAGVLGRLREGPLPTEVRNPLLFGRVEDVVMTHGVFAMGLRSMLYGWESSARLPFVVTRAAAGDFSPMAEEIIARDLPLELVLAKGQYLSVTCAEDVPFIDRAAAAAAADGTTLGTYRLDQHIGACEVWPRGEVPADWLDPVTVDVPTLLFSAELDPSTPPRTGEQVARHLPNALLVVMENETHGAEVNWERCGRPLTHELLRTGSIAGLDTSCARRIERAPWFVPQRD